MLYPCGELAANRDTMVAGLAEKGIGCESVPVYKTEPNPELKIILTRVFNEKVQNINRNTNISKLYAPISNNIFDNF
jgi:uroporphyrinogen-III synthase